MANSPMWSGCVEESRAGVGGDFCSPQTALSGPLAIACKSNKKKAIVRRGDKSARSTYIRIMFPSVWSSLAIVNMQAFGTLVSFSMVILYKKKL